MKDTLIQLIKKTPIYPVLKNVRQKQEVRDWERRGKPAPPPHIIKQQAIREFAKKYGTSILVETGTFHGDMVEAMKDHFIRIYSIELSDALYEKARQRFSGDDRITIIHGNSGIELGKLIPRLNQPVLFWLDGHYSAGVTAKGDKDTPIYEELEHILGSPQKQQVIIIDDARCFGTDPAYPSIDELSEFIKARNPDAKIDVENDGIRIILSNQSQ